MDQPDHLDGVRGGLSFGERGCLPAFSFPFSADLTGRSHRLARVALSKKRVLLCPGEQFGMEDYLRIGFGGHTGELIEALGRVEELIH